jgi:hypothetical protein
MKYNEISQIKCAVKNYINDNNIFLNIDDLYVGYNRYKYNYIYIRKDNENVWSYHSCDDRVEIINGKYVSSDDTVFETNDDIRLINVKLELRKCTLKELLK